MPHRPARPASSTPARGHEPELPADLSDDKVACLPVIANFLQKIGTTALVDAKVASPQNISSGQVVSGMVMNNS